MSGLKILHSNPYSSDIDVPCVEYSDEEHGGPGLQSHSIPLPITNASMQPVVTATGNNLFRRSSSTHRRRSHKTPAASTGSMLLKVPGKSNAPQPKPMKMAAMPSPVASVVQPVSTHATPVIQPSTLAQPQPIVQQQTQNLPPQQEGQLSKLWNALGTLQGKALTYLTGDASQIPAAAPGSQPYVPQNASANGSAVSPGQAAFLPLSQQIPIPTPTPQVQSNQFLQPPGGFAQQPMQYPQAQSNYYLQGNGPQMASPYYGFQPSQMQPPTTSFYNPNFNSMYTPASQDSPYKKMVKKYKQKDKSGKLPAGVDLSDSDDDYDDLQKTSTENTNKHGQNNFIFVGIFVVIAIVMLVITSSTGSSAATTVASTGTAAANIASDLKENFVPTSSSNNPTVVQAPSAVTPVPSLFQQLMWVLRTIIILAIAGLAIYYYFTGNFPESSIENSSSKNQSTQVKERPGPLLPALNWWDVIQQGSYPPFRWVGFGGAPQGYPSNGTGLGAIGQPYFQTRFSSLPFSNGVVPSQMGMPFDADDDDDEEYDSDECELEGTGYQEYLPAGMFDSRYEPNYFLNKEAKAKALAKAQAEAAAKMMPKEPGPAAQPAAPDNKVVFSKSDLPEEFKPYYEPMPPLPGIDDPDPPVSDTLVKTGPDKEKLQEVTKNKAQKNSEGATKGILKKDSDKERIKGVKEGKSDYFMDDYSCKPYGPPPRRYTGVVVDKAS